MYVAGYGFRGILAPVQLSYSWPIEKYWKQVTASGNGKQKQALCGRVKDKEEQTPEQQRFLHTVKVESLSSPLRSG